MATVPDERLDRFVPIYNPRKLIHATIEYADVAATSAEALKESALLNTLRTVDSLTHVVRAFDNPAVPHGGEIDPLRDIRNIDVDLMVSDLGQIEKRIERVQQDLKRMKSAELEREHELLQRALKHLESERPLRDMEMTAADKKMVRGFMFLSEKPILHVLNIGESTDLGADLDKAVEKYGLQEVAARPGTGATAVCGKVEAERAEMDKDEAAEFLSSYGLQDSGLMRLIRKTYELLGLISFFTVGEDECRAWTVARGTPAAEAAGAIHTDLQKHFIRAETIHWDQLLEAGSEAIARSKGTLRLEGKDYIVKAGDVMHIRHSG